MLSKDIQGKGMHRWKDTTLWLWWWRWWWQWRWWAQWDSIRDASTTPTRAAAAAEIVERHECHENQYWMQTHSLPTTVQSTSTPTVFVPSQQRLSPKTTKYQYHHHVLLFLLPLHRKQQHKQHQLSNEYTHRSSEAKQKGSVGVTKTQHGDIRYNNRTIKDKSTTLLYHHPLFSNTGGRCPSSRESSQ